MGKDSKISQIVQICAEECFADIPTISFSQASDGSCNVVFVGGDEKEFQKGMHIPECQVFHMTEEKLLEKILHRDPILIRLFSNAIVLRDLLQIMPLILNSLPYYEDYGRTPMHAGDLAIVFHDVHSPEMFVTKTFIPFMEMNKADLSKCRFVISSHTVNHRTDIEVNFFGLKEDFDLLEFERQLIMNISELSLHKISVRRHCSELTIADENLLMLQEISEQAVSLYSSGNDLDGVVRKVLKCYFDILSDNADSINECLAVNQHVLEELLPRSLSSVTTDSLLFHDKSVGIEKVKKEYRTQFNVNQKYFFDEVSCLLKSARTCEVGEALSKEDISKRNEGVIQLYSAVFSALMMHPYYLAFIPFCMNEVLKYLDFRNGESVWKEVMKLELKYEI